VISEDNVEQTRNAVEAINRGDVAAAFDGARPDVEWKTLDDFPDATTHRGIDEVRNFFETWRDTFRAFHLDLERCEAVGDDHVLAVLRVGGEGVASGIEVESPVFIQLLEYRQGELIRGEMFRTEAEARKAAGLPDGSGIARPRRA
jgi:ketosteroid isomerase-like protein